MSLSLTLFSHKFLPKVRPNLVLALFGLLVSGIILIYTYQRDVGNAMTHFIWKQAKLQSIGTNVPRPLKDVLLTEPKPKPGRTIFFLETTRIVRPKPEMMNNMLQLTARQACAIESAALHNPTFEVFVLFAGPTYSYPENSSQHQQPIIDAILSYKNVQLRQLNLRRYATGTPIEDWVKYGELFSSRFPIHHVSDLLRLITLYRYGGIYLDMDVVLLRSMEDVPLNYAGVESYTHVANGVLSMAPTGFGHEFAKSCLLDFQQQFDGDAWGHNGPGVITRVAQRICGTTNMSLMLEDRTRCQGFKVFNHTAFYAVSYTDWRHFFQPQYLQQTLARTKNSYLVHVWNQVSKVFHIKVGSRTAYGKYAEKNCPRAYAAAAKDKS
ncbi:lactosylceramide 4-alpha-galactosyltransferase-like isoform X2 [Drosophila novamexicana]|uniref:lactosylceramide 4-alpha-galactosyltransferase-like isoform X2 n=1 Tax=Drosophila novamexicana TaxID=47314 RepID=UPI0011E5E8D6|nr:lactosylceramide 4-alpha-galactosyltransferase-like isoform X2 [Drosophila novamexicana]